jgi:hypothetical protein
MTTDELLRLLKDRGLEVVLLPSGVPALRGPNVKTEATRRLLRVLQLPAHREEILERLRPKPRREFRWADGHTRLECANDEGFRQPDWHPFCAWWWRHEGEADWRPLPHRIPDASAN